MGETARAARAARIAGLAVTPSKYWVGEVTEITDATHCLVLSGDKEVPCVVPASLVVNKGASVQVRVRGNDYLVDSVLSGDNQPADLIEQIAAANDPRQASAPTGLTVTPSLVLGTDRQWRVRVTAAWNAVTTATDATSIEVARYRLWAKSGTGSWQTIAETSGLTAAVDGFAPGSTWTFAVTAVPAKLRESDPTGTAAMTLPTDTTAPERPSDPLVESAPAAVSVTWDGLDKDGAAMAADLAQVNVLMGTSNPPTEIVASFRGQGTWLGMAEPHTELWISLVAIDTSGNESGATTPVNVTVKSVLDDTDLADRLSSAPRLYTSTTPPGSTVSEASWWLKADDTVWKYVSGAWVQQTSTDLGAISASNLIATLIAAAGATIQDLAADSATVQDLYAKALVAATATIGNVIADKVKAGAIDGFVITGATVRTGESGARVVLDSSGLHGYDSAGAEKTRVGTDGKLVVTDGTFTGTISGSTITGSTLTVTDGGYGALYANGSDGFKVNRPTSGSRDSGFAQIRANTSGGSGFYTSSTTLFPEVFLSKTTTGGVTLRTWYGIGYIIADGFTIQGKSGDVNLFNSGGDVNLSASGNALVNATKVFIDGSLRNLPNTTTASANARWSDVQSDGYRYTLVNTSLRKWKKRIQDLDIDADDVLKLEPRTWFDRTQIEAKGLDPESVTEEQCLSAGLRRIPGFIAEEVEAIDSRFAQYDLEWMDDGNGDLASHEVLAGVAYDRISAALLVLAKDQQTRIETLEATVAELAAIVKAS